MCYKDQPHDVGKTASLKTQVDCLDLQMEELPSEGEDGDGSMIRFLTAFLSEKQRKKTVFATDPVVPPWSYWLGLHGIRFLATSVYLYDVHVSCSLVIGADP